MEEKLVYLYALVKKKKISLLNIGLYLEFYRASGKGLFFPSKYESSWQEGRTDRVMDGLSHTCFTT